MIVSLDSSGHVLCSYLGTDPIVFKAKSSSNTSATSYQVSECLACNDMLQLLIQAAFVSLCYLIRCRYLVKC